MNKEIEDCNTCKHLHLDWKMAMPSECWTCDFDNEDFKGYEYDTELDKTKENK